MILLLQRKKNQYFRSTYPQFKDAVASTNSNASTESRKAHTALFTERKTKRQVKICLSVCLDRVRHFILHLSLGEVVALKRLKMEKEREGFPITSLREVCTLLKAHHKNIVRVQVLCVIRMCACGNVSRRFLFFIQEIVVGSNMDKIYIVMDYVEHDLKSLMETMKQPFLVGKFVVDHAFSTYCFSAFP